MGPVMGNLSQVNYSLTACIGGLLCIFKNFDVGGLTVFLNFSRQFSRPINEISMQVSNVFSALAGAERVFAIMDEQPEQADDADAVTLQPMTRPCRIKGCHLWLHAGQGDLKEYQFVCKAWTEDRFCWFYRCRKDHDHQPSESFL